MAGTVGRWWARATRIPVAPVLVAIFPVVFLFAENAVQEVTFKPLWLPLVAALGIGIGAQVGCTLLLRDRQRGALLAAWALILFFTFGRAWHAFSDLLAGRWELVIAWVVLLLVGGALIWRGRRWVRPVNGYLTVAVTLLLVFNAFRIGDWAVGAATAERPTLPPPIPAVMPDHPRDIYYIILDRYASASSLSEFFGYDNTPFLNELRDRGFVIADDAWANYLKTAFSLVSSLSMDYLDGDALRDGDPATFGPIFARLQDHLTVPLTLTDLGYEYVHIGNYWEPTSTNVDADLVLRYEEGSEFGAAVWSTTALSPLSPPVRIDTDSEVTQLYQDARGHALFGFNAVEDAASRPGPTYTFAHILMPHPPYVFNLDGSMPTPEEMKSRTEEQQYVIQLEWTNQRVLQMLDTIMDAPPDQQPIVILQADEGPWPHAFTADEKNFQWLKASAAQIRQKYGILNAMYLPGVDPAAAGFTQETSPVNEFRIVFNAYFGTDLPILPNDVYLSPDYAHMYDFTEYQRP
jgi:hypothetical protein